MKPGTDSLPRLHVGEHVLVTRGLAAGHRGTIIELWPRGFGRVPMWIVDLGGVLSRRVIREDYLEVAS